MNALDEERTRAEIEKLRAEAANHRSEAVFRPLLVAAAVFGATAAIGKLFGSA